MQNNIDLIAFELFREWTKNAAIDYPDLDFTIVDERILVKDLEETLEDALNSLLKTEKTEKRLISGYDYGFIIGFIDGKLNVHWAFEYITKRSKEFKSFLINKTMYEYLQVETLTAIKIKALYEKMYEDTLNLESLNYDLPKTRIEEFKIAELEENNFSIEEHNPVMVFLKNQFSEQLLNLLKIKINSYLPNLEKFFDREFVGELIHNRKENQKH